MIQGANTTTEAIAACKNNNRTMRLDNQLSSRIRHRYGVIERAHPYLLRRCWEHGSP
jgi:hypothetical protein